MDKTDLVGQLLDQLEASARAALTARDAVVTEARDGATPDEKREDARAAHQAQSLGRAQQKRAQQAIAAADALAGFKPPKLPPTAKIGLGAIVEIEDADSGEGRTFFLAPVGAGSRSSGWRRWRPRRRHAGIADRARGDRAARAMSSTSPSRATRASGRSPRGLGR
jgi:hypothetical protein